MRLLQQDCLPCFPTQALTSLKHGRRMGRFSSAFLIAIGTAALMVCPNIQAQIPVTDIAAITQSATNQAQTIARLIQQYQQMVQQLQVAQQTLNSLSGFRNAGQALIENGVGRQALPANYAANLAGLLTQGASAASPIAQRIFGQIKTTPCSGWGGSPNVTAACQAPVILSASLSETTTQALQSAQARVAQLQGLASKADTTTDTKASADLQARIASEEAQLLAEKTMLDYAIQVQQAEAQLAVQHQEDLGLRIATQQGRSCYSCP
jgi:type IV secretion system protein VirB5